MMGLMEVNSQGHWLHRSLQMEKRTPMMLMHADAAGQGRRASSASLGVYFISPFQGFGLGGVEGF